MTTVLGSGKFEGASPLLTTFPSPLRERGDTGGEVIKIELEPELSACIKTKAKREYQKTLRELLKKGEESELKERLETLRLFLQTTAFKQLREQYERYLIAGRRVRFILRLEEGKPKYDLKIT